MNTISTEVKHKIEIKKSEFICHLKNVNSEEEAKEYIKKIKNLYSDATHNCSGYIIDQVKKVDDDGEPSGTAGLPILNVLEHHNINNIVCVVTRYFGGIKLGAGGLIRAYAKSVSETINNTQLTKLIQGELLELEVNFDVNDSINYYLNKNNIEIIEINYAMKVNYLVKVAKEEKEGFEERIKLISHLNKVTKKKDIMMVDNEKKNFNS